MTIVNENGLAYQIVNGRVVTAVNTKEAKTVAEPLKFEDRVMHGKKLGKVVSLIPSIYGQSIGVRFDDGSFGEFLAEDIERTAPEKVAKVAGLPTNEDFKDEYDEYVAMPIDTLEEVEDKMRIARTLNLRAKAQSSNSKNALADTVIYDSIVTATAVDLMDLEQMQEGYRVSENREYLESLPQYEVPETISPSFGLTRGGDASWLGDEELEPEAVDEAWLAQQAAQTVASLDREQLQDPNFMKQVLQYRFEFIPKDQAARTKFAGLVTEAKRQKLSESEREVKTASAKQVDLEGNEISLEDVDVEALYF